MTVEYTVKKDGSWVEISYKLAPHQTETRLRVHNFSVIAMSTTDTYDNGMSLIPATTLYFNGHTYTVPIPFDELSVLVENY